MRTRMAAVVLALLVPAGLGCATLFAPGPDELMVFSEPAGASVELDGNYVGTTPCLVTVARSSEGVFTFHMSGYETATVDREKVCNGLTALNLLGGYVTIPVFFAIDILTGNVGKYSTKPIRVILKPVEPPPPPPTTPIGRSWEPGRRWSFEALG